MNVGVVGAGVLGASAALHLRRLGADVTLLDGGGPGSGTSSRGAGLVSEGMWHPASLALVRRSLALMERMGAEGDELGHPFRFHRTGSTTIVPASHAANARALARMQARHGAEVRELMPDDLRALPHHEGMRVDDVAAAFHYPRDGWALPRLLAEVSAVQSGARVVRAQARLERGERPVLVAKGERMAFDAVVVACGVHTRALLQDAGLDAPIRAYRTQALRATHPAAAGVPILHDAIQNFYLRPGIPQHLVAGNGTTTRPEDAARWKEDADASFVEATLRRLRHRFPWFPADVHVDAWAGIDAATPDRLLLAGAHPHDPRVFVLAGGNGHGFMRAPAAGEALAHLVMGERPPTDLAAFDPARFADPGADFEIREGYSLEAGTP